MKSSTAAFAFAGVAGLAAAGAAVLSWESLASRAAEWIPSWGSFYAYEIAVPAQITNYSHGSLRVPLRAGQRTLVRWEATALRGGTLRIGLIGPGGACATELTEAGAGDIVFSIGEPGFYRLEVRGSATSRTGEGHRFVGTPGPDYELVYRARWFPLTDRAAREIAERGKRDDLREIACPSP